MVDQRHGRGLLEAEIVGYGEDVSSRNGDVFGESAADVLADDPEPAAEALLALATPLAVATPETRIDEHASAHLHVVHALAQPYHSTGQIRTADVGELELEAR